MRPVQTVKKRIASWFRRPLDGRLGFFIFVLVFVVFHHRPLMMGEVVFPHDNAAEVGRRPSRGEGSGYRKFSDASAMFVPEVHLHLHGNGSGWLNSWNPHVEMGRPAFLLGGLSPVFLPTRALFAFTDDATRAFTWIATLASFSVGLFAFLLMRERHARPSTAAATAIVTSLGVRVIYWLTFPVFNFSLGLSLGVLWAIERLVRRNTVLDGVLLAFLVHLLLLAGYPQKTVWSAYICTVYSLHAVCTSNGSVRARGVQLLKLGGWAAIGAASTLPVYSDLFISAARSPRLSTPVEYFVATLPSIDSMRNLVAWVVATVQPWLLGDPLEPSYPVPFGGVTIMPLCLFGLTACLAPRVLRRIWPFAGLLALALLMTAWTPAYEVAVRHFGMRISRTSPLGGIEPVVVLLVGHGYDHLISRARLRWVPGLVAAVGVGVVAWLPGMIGLETSVNALLGTAASGVAVLIATVMGSGRVLLVASVLSVFLWGSSLGLWRSPDSIARSSPLVSLLREELDAGERYVSFDSAAIEPNQEAQLGLRSAHSYNPLAATSYRRWARRVSRHGFSRRGKRFSRAVRRRPWQEGLLAEAGVGVLVTRRRVPRHLARHVGRRGLYHVWRLRRAPVLAERARAFVLRRGTDQHRAAEIGRTSPDVGDMSVMEVHDDEIVVTLERAPVVTLVRLSQQFHPLWTASSHGETLETVEVDGLYQGVLAPSGADAIRLHFVPQARWMQLVQVLYCLAFLGILMLRCVRRSLGRPKEVASQELAEA